jgi:hypothetical protein
MVAIERSPSGSGHLGYQASNKRASDHSAAHRNGLVVVAESVEMQGVFAAPLAYHLLCIKPAVELQMLYIYFRFRRDTVEKVFSG